MSRIGKKIIEIPQGVKVEILQSEGRNEIRIFGSKGELKQEIHPEIKVEVKDNAISVSPKTDNLKDIPNKNRGLWGLYRALISNMVEGVTKGFEKRLEIEGVGFRASVEGDILVLNLGFTNPIKIKKEEGVNFSVEKNVIIVSGINKERVGYIASLIRKQKKAEPYKGKGIKYQGEKIRRKEGKKVVATAK